MLHDMCVHVPACRYSRKSRNVFHSKGVICPEDLSTILLPLVSFVMQITSHFKKIEGEIIKPSGKVFTAANKRQGHICASLAIQFRDADYQYVVHASL